MEEQEIKNENVEPQAAEPTQTPVTVEPTSERPTFLTVLCILTFVGSGLGVLFSLLAVVGMGTLLSYLGSMGGAAGGGTAYFIALLVIAGGSLYGALQMWGLKKIGFFIYTGANVVGLILPLFFGLGFSFFGAVITIAFVVMYYLNMKFMS